MNAKNGNDEIEIAIFKADITPSVGAPLDGGLTDPVVAVEHPLFAKGVVLRSASEIVVLCAVDYCSIANTSYDQFRQKLASAAGTSADRVAIQTVHQHSSPIVDSDAQELVVGQRDNLPDISALDSFEIAVSNIANAIRKSVGNWTKISHIGRSWAAVDRVASSRRILQPDNTILCRLSRAPKNDPKYTEKQLAPEGYIDGFLRTVSFFSGDKPIVNMHYYATHPQSSYGHGHVSYDVPGIARERLEAETDVFQIYFNGCGGDVAMGKYNDESSSCRAALTERLFDGMVRSLSASQKEPASAMNWKTIDVHFPFRTDEEFSESNNRKRLCDKSLPKDTRIKAAMNLACIKRIKEGRSFQLSSLSIGSVRMLHLPAEPFVEYQLWAQKQVRPEILVAVAGYGDCAIEYIPTDQAYSEQGGYELSWAFLDPSEVLLKKVIKELVS